jgi:hypothetical protein
VAFLALTGSALAGTTATTAVTYAREVSAVNQVYTLPGTTTTRAMAVIRNATQDFFVDVSLGQGALFTGAGLPVAGDLTLSVAAGGVVTSTVVSGGTAGASTVRFFVDITTAFTGLPTLALDTNGWMIRDVNNVLGAGNPIQITIATNDAATNSLFDSGADIATLATSANAVTAGTLTSTTATIDVATNRKKLLATGGDTTTVDNGATVVLNIKTAGIKGLDGTTDFVADDGANGASTNDIINVVIAGPLSGITSVSVAGTSQGVTATDVTNGNMTIPLQASTITGNPQIITITVDGATQLTVRTLTIATNYKSGSTTPATQDHAMGSAATLTVWGINGTILVSNWSNGNAAVLTSRIYLWNPSATGGAITVRVFALPITSSSPSVAGTPIATVDAGTIGGTSGRNLRLAEDILLVAGVTLPYTTDGGNLVVEVTIEAINVSGAAQSFSGSLAYGTTPMTKIQ